MFAAEMPYRLEHPRALVSPLTGYVVAYLFSWVALGQGLWNLPRYVFGSSWLSSGYVDAMAMTDPDHKRAIICGAVGLFLWLIAVLYRLMKIGVAPRPLAVAFLLVLSAYMTWKHGIVRADVGHLEPMLGYVLILWLMVPVLGDAGKSADGGDSKANSPGDPRWSSIRIGRILLVCASIGLCTLPCLAIFRASGCAWSYSELRPIFQYTGPSVAHAP